VEALDKIGIGFIRTNVGDKYISRELVREDLNVGAEPSGHIIQREFSESGDANIALVQTISALQELDTTMFEIKSKINYKPLTLKNFAVKDAHIIETISFNETVQALKDRFPSARISIRKSGTESGTEPVIRVMAEADTDNDKDEILNKIESLIV
jgi:phosphoglucosamine mutase